MPFKSFFTFGNKTRIAIFALIIANIIWGAALPIYKWTLEVIPPFTFSFLRFFIAAIIILPFVVKNFKFEKKDIPLLVLGAIVSISLQIPLLFFGLKLAPSINAPIIISSGPIILLASSVIFFKERISKKLLFGTLISLLGVLILIFRPAVDSGFSGSVLGNFFVLLATLCSVVQSLAFKKIVARNDPMTSVFLTFLIGSLVLLPPSLLEFNATGFFTLNLNAVLGLSFAVIFSSVIAHYFLYYGLKNIKVSETGIFTYVDPIATILVAIPLLHEVITESYMISAILVFLGIYIAEGRINYHPFHLLKKARIEKFI